MCLSSPARNGRHSCSPTVAAPSAKRSLDPCTSDLMPSTPCTWTLAARAGHQTRVNERPMRWPMRSQSLQPSLTHTARKPACVKVCQTQDPCKSSTSPPITRGTLVPATAASHARTASCPALGSAVPCAALAARGEQQSPALRPMHSVRLQALWEVQTKKRGLTPLS